MNGQREGLTPSREGQRPQEYEPPRVEQVVTEADLEREVLYAGVSQ